MSDVSAITAQMLDITHQLGIRVDAITHTLRVENHHYDPETAGYSVTNVTVSHPIKDDLQDVVLSFGNMWPSASGNAFVSDLKLEKTITTKAWVDPTLGLSVKTVDLHMTLLNRNHTNGVSGAPLVVMFGTFNRMPVAIKFRKQTRNPDTEADTYREMQSAMHIHEHEKAGALFVKVFFAGVIPNRLTSRERWEFIGMQFLSSPRSTLYSGDDSVYSIASKKMAALHKCGYIHGDAHPGNIMMDLNMCELKEYNPKQGMPRMFFIDFDRVENIAPDPDDDDTTIAAKTMCTILDYYIMMYLDNPYMPNTGTLVRSRDAASKWRERAEGLPYDLFIPPFHPFEIIGGGTLNQFHTKLSSSSLSGYKNFLLGIRKQVADQFQAVMASNEKMKRLDQRISDFYNKTGRHIKDTTKIVTNRGAS